MKIPSIEELKLHVADIRTKESLDEVLASFYSGNMRSAVVMLYSTVVSDVYYKICDLVNLYNDSGAKTILEYVEKEWKDHKTSSAWETDMPKKCRDANKIFNNVSYCHFCNLQMQRNLCAHPVIDIEKGLYKPNPATVQGLIIELMEGVLCRPAFLSKDFFNVFTDDIAKSSDAFPTSKGLCDYIKAKYLEKIDNEVEEYEIFKKLWKLVFKKTDEKSSKNRRSSNAVLNMLLDRNDVFFIEKFREGADYYAENVNLEEWNCLCSFIRLANFHREIYKFMPQHFVLKFKETINQDNDLLAMSFCIEDNALVHANNIKSGISWEVALYSFNYLNKVVGMPDALDFCIRMYGNSACYNDADNYFENIIEPNINGMTEEQLKQLIELSNKNSQIYDRKKANSAKYTIKKYMEEKNPRFDYSPYRHFN